MLKGREGGSKVQPLRRAGRQKGVGGGGSEGGGRGGRGGAPNAGARTRGIVDGDRWGDRGPGRARPHMGMDGRGLSAHLQGSSVGGYE